MNYNKLIKNYILKSKLTKLFFKIIRYYFNDLVNFKIINEIKSDEKIVIFTSIGDHTYYAKYDRYLERSFNLLGFEVIIVLCNTNLDICQEFNYNFSNRDKISDSFKNLYCNFCKKNSEKNFKNSKIEYLGNVDDSQYLNLKSLFMEHLNKYDSIENFFYNGINFGEHINSGLVRYYGGSIFEKNDIYYQNLYKFANASFKTYFSTLKILKKYKIKLSMLHHGIYVPQGVVCDVLKKNNVNFYTYGMSYRKNTFFYAYKDTYHKRFLDLNEWDKFNFGKKELRILHRYFKKKIISNQDWIDFTSNNNLKKFNKIQEITSYYTKENTYVMYTNVDWDAQVHFKNNVFKSMHEWIERTIDYFETNKDKLLIIRIHPAEIYGNVKSRTSLAEHIQNYKKIKNLIIIKAKENINSYSLMKLSNKFLVYSSKIAIELLFFNKKVLVAGEAFVRGKGFTLDTNNEKEYTKDLEKLKYFNLTKYQKILSKKFIYFFFFKLMVDNNFLIKGSILKHPYYAKQFNLSDLKNDKNYFNAIKSMLASEKIISN